MDFDLLVYSFPQISILPERQSLINAKRRQYPEYRSITPRIIKKAAQTLRDGFKNEFYNYAEQSRVATSDARSLNWLGDNSVDLIITSPPFLDKVDYLTDNWLEFWFAGVNPRPFEEKLLTSPNLDEWRSFMRDVLRESLRVLRPNCFAVIEVGEVETAHGTINLDQVLAEEAERIRYQDKIMRVEEILVNQQSFSKLSNCFQVENNRKGTNTNRLVVLSSSSQKLKRK